MNEQSTSTTSPSKLTPMIKKIIIAAIILIIIVACLVVYKKWKIQKEIDDAAAKKAADLAELRENATSQVVRDATGAEAMIGVAPGRRGAR